VISTKKNLKSKKHANLKVLFILNDKMFYFIVSIKALEAQLNQKEAEKVY